MYDVPLTAAERDVIFERRRQVLGEGWTLAHDDAHHPGAMAQAAATYCLHAYESDFGLEFWPWDRSWFKPKNIRRDLVRSAALILAEIERFDRASVPTTAEGTGA